MKMFAVRNIRLCTKDCLCLYVCPTHATDTETGQIDFKKCTGCGVCVNACPSHAISLVPYEMPDQQLKSDDIKKSLGRLFKSKVLLSTIFESMGDEKNSESSKRFFKAACLSSRAMGEDIIREAGYMLPTSSEAVTLIESLKSSESSFEVKNLLEQLLLMVNSDPRLI